MLEEAVLFLPFIFSVIKMTILSPTIKRRAKSLRLAIGKIGVVEAFTIIHTAPTGFDRYAPYPVAIAKFGNKKLIAQVTDFKDNSLSIGSKVKCVLRRSRREGEKDVIEYVIKFKPL